MDSANRPRLLGVFLLLLALAAPAHAHKFKCFALTEGKKIAGYGYMGGGGRPVNVAYTVTAPDGAVLHEGKTNEKGEFAFEARFRCDHMIVMDTGDGHRASYTVPAAELPDSLPPYAKGRGDALPPPPPPPPEDSDALDVSEGVAPEALAALVGQAVQKQIAPLRMELDAFKEERRFQDALGAVGYLVGAAGLAFYFLGVRRKERVAKERGPC